MVVRNILLIGRTGSGKSTLANIISKSNHFNEGKYGASETRNTNTIEIVIDEINYRLIDTVGIGDTSLREEQVLNKISDAAYVARDGFSQVLFITKDKFTKEEIEVYHILKKAIFDKDIGKYTTIVKTNFPDFEDDDECEKDKKSMKESEEMKRVINSCCRMIHVDNPPLNIKNERRVAIHKEVRNQSRKILRTYLLSCRDTYRPNNLDGLNERIGEYVSEKENLRKRLEELENLSKKEREKHQEEINELTQKLIEHEIKIAQETRGWFERAGALLGEGIDNTINTIGEGIHYTIDTISKAREERGCKIT